VARLLRALHMWEDGPQGRGYRANPNDPFAANGGSKGGRDAARGPKNCLLRPGNRSSAASVPRSSRPVTGKAGSCLISAGVRIP